MSSSDGGFNGYRPTRGKFTGWMTALRLASLAQGTIRFGPARREACARSAGRIEWCGRGDSNPHGIATASPSSWCVCQFRHFREEGTAPINGCPTRSDDRHAGADENSITLPALSVPVPAALALVRPARAPLAYSTAALRVRVRRAPSWDHADRQCRDTTRR